MIHFASLGEPGAELPGHVPEPVRRVPAVRRAAPALADRPPRRRPQFSSTLSWDGFLSTCLTVTLVSNFSQISSDFLHFKLPGILPAFPGELE